MTSPKKRIQIQVDKGLASRLTQLAEIYDRSLSWMAATMLSVAIDERQETATWIASRVTGILTSNFFNPIEKTEETVYLQVFLEESEIEELNDLAERLNNTPSKLGALLLERIAMDQEIIVRMVGYTVQIKEALNRIGYCVPGRQPIS